MYLFQSIKIVDGRTIRNNAWEVAQQQGPTFRLLFWEKKEISYGNIRIWFFSNEFLSQQRLPLSHNACPQLSPCDPSCPRPDVPLPHVITKWLCSPGNIARLPWYLGGQSRSRELEAHAGSKHLLPSYHVASSHCRLHETINKTRPYVRFSQS